MGKGRNERMYQSEYRVLSKEKLDKPLDDLLEYSSKHIEEYGLKPYGVMFNQPQTLEELEEESAFIYLDVPFLERDSLRFDIQYIEEHKKKAVYVDMSTGQNLLSSYQAKWINYVVGHLILGLEPEVKLEDLLVNVLQNQP